MSSVAKCAFCQRVDLRMSREHVLPGWLLTYLDDTTGRGDMTMVRDGSVLSMRELITRRVCVDCNTGWMADLEGMAAPLMSQMMTSRVLLAPVHQAILSRWAVKTMLTAHLAMSPRKNELWLTPAAFEHFQSGPIAMPRRLTVLLGAYEGEIGGISGVEPLQVEVHRTTLPGALPTVRFRFLGIVFHVLIVPEQQTMHFTIEEELKARLHLIWPPLQHATTAEPVPWPPPSTFDSSSLDELWGIVPSLGEASRSTA